LESAKANKVPVHIELASLADDGLTTAMANSIFGDVDSIGLNEQELSSLFQAVGGEVSKLPLSRPIVKETKGNDAKPTGLVGKAKRRLMDVKDSVFKWRILRNVIDKIMSLKTAAQTDEDAEDDAEGADAKSEDGSNNPLTGNAPDLTAVSHAIAHILNAGISKPSLGRVHFHTLGYHVVALHPRHADKWGNSMASVARGSVRATLQACNATGEQDLHGDDLDLKTGLKINFGTAEDPEHLKVTKDSPVLTFTVEGIQMYYAPVLVCKEPVVVVGLGDAISASALSAYSM